MTVETHTRIATAYLHAAGFLSAYILLKEITFWTPLLDSLVAVVGALAVVAVTLLLPRIRRRPVGIAWNGLAAGLATALVSYAIWSLVWSDWARDKPLGYAPVAVIVGMANLLTTALWLLSIGCMVAAIAAGGVVASAASTAARKLGTIGITFAVAAGLLVSVVPAGASFARLTAGIGFLNLVTRYETLRPFPAKVTVDLTVRGEHVALERVVTCQRPRSIREEAEAGRANPRLPKPYWLPSIKSFGHVFADGSGIFVITPDACRDIAVARERIGALAPSTASALSAGYVPLVGWTANAASLATFDLLIDRSAYRPNAPITVNAVEMSALPYGTKASAPDRFAAIGWHKFYTDTPEYGGYYAVAIPPEVWEAHPLAGPEVKGVSDFSFVFGSNPIRPLAMGAKGYEDLDTGTQYPEYGRNGSGIPERLRENERKPLSGPVVPLRRDGDSWRLSPEEHGVISFERGLRTDGHQPRMPEVVSIESRSGDRRGEPNDGAYLFDPATQTLYRIMPTRFHLPRPDSVFSSQTCDWGCSDWIALVKKKRAD